MAKPKSSRAKPPKKRQPTRAITTPDPSILDKLAKRRLVRFGVLWFTAYVVLMGFFINSVFSKYTSIEAFPWELVAPSLMHAVTALFVALVIFWLPWLRSCAGRLVAAITLALLMVGYNGNLQAVENTIRAFLPSPSESDSQALISLIYLILLCTMSVFIGKGAERLLGRTQRVQPRDISLGLLTLIGFSFITSSLYLAKNLPTMVQQSRVQAPELANLGKATDKPDIYYIVLDRYTNADILHKQFNYDNSAFANFLKANDFTVNDHAYSNYPYTTMSIASAINAQYTNDLVAPYKNQSRQNRTLYHNLIWHSSVAKALKKEGYVYHAIGAPYGASNRAPLADIDYQYQHQVTLFGVKKRLRGLEVSEFVKSPYVSFAQLSGIKWWPFTYESIDNLVTIRQQLNNLDKIVSEPPGGRFIFAHILVPHDPFYFNADGSLSFYNGTDSIGKPIKQKYTDQVTFINSQMTTLIQNIQKQSDGKAVILLNADEGPYPQFLNDTFKKPQTSDQSANEALLTNEDMRTWSDDYLAMKFGILQAVHIPEASKDDLAHLSSVNLFRIVLNSYFGYQLDYQPTCHFGIIDGTQNEFKYADITSKFHEQPAADCKQRESLPDY